MKLRNKLRGDLFQFHGILTHIKNGKLYIFVMAIVLGILLGMQINSASNTSRELSYPVRKITNQINHDNHEIKYLKREIFSAEYQKRKLEHDRLGESESYLELKKRLIYLKMISGESKITGEGVILVIDSGKDENIALKIDNKKIFLLLINELRLNGAETIAINGQQITNLSGITLAGSHLDINNTEIGPEYEVKIIGDSDKLYRFLDKKSVTVIFMKKVYQFHVSLRKVPYIEIGETRISKPMPQITSKRR